MNICVLFLSFFGLQIYGFLPYKKNFEGELLPNFLFLRFFAV